MVTPTKKKVAKSKRPEAERAGEHYLHAEWGCVITRRALRTKFARVDFFAADIIGKTSEGVHVYAQVTAGSSASGAIRTRRRKLERIPWHETDLVLLLQLVKTPNPVNGNRTDYWFKIHEYDYWSGSSGKRVWNVREDAFPLPTEWFKAMKDPERGLNDPS